MRFCVCVRNSEDMCTSDSRDTCNMTSNSEDACKATSLCAADDGDGRSRREEINERASCARQSPYICI